MVLFFGLSVWIDRIGGARTYTRSSLNSSCSFSALTHRVAIKVSHSVAVSNANNCSHSAIGSLKSSVGLCIMSHPHAAREVTSSIKPLIHDSTDFYKVSETSKPPISAMERLQWA